MNTKETNPKDAVGVKKWRQFSTIPTTVLAEVGVGMLEGARKYGRHNYRVAGVRSSVYFDAAWGHLMQWWEGEDIDQDSGLSHITKAICSLFVLRDAMIQNMLTDDRPPKANLDALRADLQRAVDEIFARHPDPVPAFIEGQFHSGGPVEIKINNPADPAVIRQMMDRRFTGSESHVKRDSHGE